MSLKPRLRQAPWVSCMALTFARSWSCWGVSPAVQSLSPTLVTALMFAGDLGPSLATLLIGPVVHKRARFNLVQHQACASAQIGALHAPSLNGQQG
jgi:hypothetical protein